jgi:hypothetical protein
MDPQEFARELDRYELKQRLARIRRQILATVLVAMIIAVILAVILSVWLTGAIWHLHR